MYTVKQLKKMSTERLHKVFASIKGYVLADKDDLAFNKYILDGFRQFMIFSIPCVEDNISVPVSRENRIVTFENEVKKIKKVAQRIARAMFPVNGLTADEVHALDTEHQKGRKNVFNYEQAMQIFKLDYFGFSYKEIAAVLDSTYQMIYQVLNSTNYHWVFEMTPDYIYQRSIEFMTEDIALPFIIKLNAVMVDCGFNTGIENS